MVALFLCRIRWCAGLRFPDPLALAPRPGDSARAADSGGQGGAHHGACRRADSGQKRRGQLLASDGPDRANSVLARIETYCVELTGPGLMYITITLWNRLVI